MTVQDAIDQLSQFPPEADLNFCDGAGFFTLAPFYYTPPKNNEDPFFLCNGFVSVVIKGINCSIKFGEPYDDCVF